MRLDVPTDRRLQSAESYAFHAESIRKTPELYQAETLRRLRAGASVTTAEYIPRRRELDEARRSIRNVFASLDLLITPTMPMPAPAIADLPSLKDYKADAGRGGRIFRERGCLACHTHKVATDGSDGLPPVKSVAHFGPNLSLIAAKIKPIE